MKKIFILVQLDGGVVVGTKAFASKKGLLAHVSRVVLTYYSEFIRNDLWRRKAEQGDFDFPFQIGGTTFDMAETEVKP